MRRVRVAAAIAAVLISGVTRLEGGEVAIGKPRVIHGIRVAAVYLAAVPWEPIGEGWGPPPERADIHLEADVAAVKGNPHGFAPGSWIPGLTIRYTLAHMSSGATQEGHLFAMVAKDGPHYGVNAKLMGNGRYTLTLLVHPPDRTGFGRHTDRETGIPPWWEPFEAVWTFTYPPRAAR